MRNFYRWRGAIVEYYASSKDIEKLFLKTWFDYSWTVCVENQRLGDFAWTRENVRDDRERSADGGLNDTARGQNARRSSSRLTIWSIAFFFVFFPSFSENVSIVKLLEAGFDVLRLIEMYLGGWGRSQNKAWNICWVVAEVSWKNRCTKNSLDTVYCAIGNNSKVEAEDGDINYPQSPNKQSQ